MGRKCERRGTVSVRKGKVCPFQGRGGAWSVGGGTGTGLGGGGGAGGGWGTGSMGRVCVAGG